jgi:hypothetical protein
LMLRERRGHLGDYIHICMYHLVVSSEDFVIDYWQLTRTTYHLPLNYGTKKGQSAAQQIRTYNGGTYNGGRYSGGTYSGGRYSGGGHGAAVVGTRVVGTVQGSRYYPPPPHRPPTTHYPPAV